MFYHVFPPLAEYSIIFNVFRYVTFRTVSAFITGLLFSMILGPVLIRTLKRKKIEELIDTEGPHASIEGKRQTPTMGGLFIMIGLICSSLLWNDLTNLYIQLLLGTALFLGLMGFVDDYLKNIRRKRKGLVAKYKLIGQISLGLAIGFVLWLVPEDRGVAYVAIPFVKETYIYLGFFFVPYVIFMITATSNAVNLTDGLDGLAAGTIAIAALALGIMAYLKGHHVYASYLNLDFIPGAGELVIFTGAMIGSVTGFLWFNTRPAEIFMGDTGSLPLGGLLANLAILLREPLFFAIIGGIFVIEALSSILQRYYFKFWRIRTGTGRRLFRCAPLHHHFEKLGIPEEKIVVRFWIISMLLTAIGFATLKVR